jgi:hypothetical protein
LIRRLVPTAVSLFALPVPPRVAAQATPIAVPAVERIAPDLELSRIIAAVAGSDGRICVLDDLELRLHCLRADGSLLWSFGRKGEGPGEWTSIYRLGIGPNNVVTVLGFGVQVHQVSADGKFLRQARLPGSFGQPGAVIAISPDTFAISGTFHQRGALRPTTIHLFAFVGDSIAHIRSFGALPAHTDPEQLSMLPAGFVSMTARRTFLHARVLPNIVVEYDMAGKLVRKVTSTIVPFDPSKQTLITKSQSRVTYQTVKPPVGSNRIGSAREYRPGSWWVFRTTVGVGQFFDVVDPATNRWLAPKPLPAWEASLGVFAEDRRGGYFLATTTCDDEPCLVRFKSGPYFAGVR